MALVSGCGAGMSREALLDPKGHFCGRLAPYVDDHSVALVEDGGPNSVTTGATLIGIIDFGCDDE